MDQPDKSASNVGFGPFLMVVGVILLLLNTSSRNGNAIVIAIALILVGGFLYMGRAGRRRQP